MVQFPQSDMTKYICSNHVTRLRFSLTISQLCFLCLGFFQRQVVAQMVLSSPTLTTYQFSNNLPPPTENSTSLSQ